MAFAGILPPQTGKLVIHQGMIGVERVSDTPQANDEISGLKRIRPLSGGPRPQRHPRRSTCEPPVFVEVVSMQFNRNACRKNVFVEGGRINRVE